MSLKKVWVIAGAGRGMGVDIAKAALAAGHKVVATGRNIEKIKQVFGKSADLLIVKLDITAYAASKFGRRLDAVVAGGSRTFWHRYHHSQPGILPHGTTHG